MNLNATILGQAIAFILFVWFCMKYVWPPLMAAIEKRQKEIADGLASAERAHKDLDLAKASATDQLKKAKAEAQVIIEQANKRRAQILDEAKTEAEQERTKIVAQAQAEMKPSVNAPVKSCVSKLLSCCCWRREDHRTFRG